MATPGCSSECQKKNRVKTNGPGAIGLRVRFVHADRTSDSENLDDCPPVRLNAADRGFETSVTLLASHPGEPSFAWRLDVTRNPGERLAEGPKARGYYLVGPGPGDLLHYRYKICEPSDIDKLTPPLPSNVWTKPGGLRTIYADDTAPYGCRDSNVEIFSSPPDTSPAQYVWYKFMRAIPGEPNGCRTHTDFRGWRVVSLLCSYGMLEHHAEIHAAMKVWFEQFVVPLDDIVPLAEN